ncbi:AAA family ATPase [Actinoplanes sp. HUAS TT8]|uniref:AAA family ATPase n=1 Tax=Actinoplanes sp. HUAS TT8 TaxID=3447453 RepID=UPI003F51B318
MSDVPGSAAVPPLRGRRREQERLDRLLREIHGGGSRVLVLRGEAGVGKTALLDYLTVRAPLGRVIRTTAVAAESPIEYAALQSLCAPLQRHLGRLPDPQHAVLATAFGLRHGEPPEAATAGPAVLALLAVAAGPEPLVCVVDDAQWLDRVSGEVLTFVAGRLDGGPAGRVGLVVAVRGPGDGPILAGRPELRVDGLAAEDARELLDDVVWWPLDDAVRERIVLESRGNPLALRQWPRADLSPYNAP